MGQAKAGSGDDFPVSTTVGGCWAQKNTVATGDSNISTRAATPARYRAEGRRQTAITPAASAARAVPCHTKCNSAQPRECMMAGGNQFKGFIEAPSVRNVAVIGGSFRTRRAVGAVRRSLAEKPCVPPAHASSTGSRTPQIRAATYRRPIAVWFAPRGGLLHRRGPAGFRFAAPFLLWS